MLFPHARHLRGAVEDGDEVWVETVVGVRTALDGAAGAERDGCAETGAEALGGWAEGDTPRRGFERGEGVVAAEEGEEGVGFRHCGCGVGGATRECEDEKLRGHRGWGCMGFSGEL